MSDKTEIQIGPGFWGSLTIVFVIFKLLGTIEWPWGYVFLPFFIPLAIYLLILIIAGIIYLVSWAICSMPYKRWR